MSVRAAIGIVHSMFDLFQEMGGGVALALNVREIARRLRMVRAELQAQGAWSAELALAANRLRTQAGHYAMARVPGAAADTTRLDAVVRAYSELLMHLEMQLWRDAGPAPALTRRAGAP